MLEDTVPIDIFLNIGIIVSLFMSLTIAGKLNQSSNKKYYTLSILLFTLIAGTLATYLYLTCQGLACLGVGILIVSISVAAIIFALGTYLGDQM